MDTRYISKHLIYEKEDVEIYLGISSYAASENRVELDNVKFSQSIKEGVTFNLVWYIQRNKYHSFSLK